MIAVIDAKNLMMRAAWTGVRKMSRKVGPGEFDPSALYNALRMLMSLYTKFPNMRELVVCADPIDDRSGTWRKQHYSAYKAQPGKKRPASQELAYQATNASLPWFRYLCGFLPNTSWYEDPFYEADDFMAYVAKHTTPNTPKMLVTADRDIMQLVDEKTTVVYPHEKAYRVLTAANFITEIERILRKSSSKPKRANVKEPFHLPIDAYLAFRCFVGDPRDNIAGLTKVAAARAMWILRGSLGFTASRHPTDLYECWSKRVDEGAEVQAWADQIRSVNPRAKDTLDFGYYMMRLDGDVQSARQSFESQPNAATVDDLFRRFRFDSLSPGGSLRQAWETFTGRLTSAY